MRLSRHVRVVVNGLFSARVISCSIYECTRALRGVKIRCNSKVNSSSLLEGEGNGLRLRGESGGPGCGDVGVAVERDNGRGFSLRRCADELLAVCPVTEPRVLVCWILIILQLMPKAQGPGLD